jgi:Tol biopolymer transport system component
MINEYRPGILLVLALLGVAFGGVACGGSGGGRGVPKSAAQAGRIAFVRGDDLWVMRPDGTRQHRLTRTRTPEAWPSWSPKGDQIAFTRIVESDSQLFVMRADGSRVRRLVRSRGDDSGPAWSPDGRWIAFSRGLDPDCFDTCPTAIYVVSADGAGLHRVSPVLDSAADFPSWSPDSRRIVFGAGGAALVGLSGGGLKVISNREDDFDPSWSPDGQRIAFVTAAQDRGVIAVMSSTGGGRRILTHGRANSTNPVWSPDGSAIAFGVVRQGRGYIGVMNADGTGQRSLGRGLEPDWTGKRAPVEVAEITKPVSPATAPGCSFVAKLIAGCGSASTRAPDDVEQNGEGPSGLIAVGMGNGSEHFDIWLVDARGRKVRRLTRAPGPDALPTWSPDGSRIAYLCNVFDDSGNIDGAGGALGAIDLGPLGHARNNGGKLCVIGRDGSGQRVLVKRITAAAPAWSPDGRRIAFARPGHGIYVVSATGSSLRRLSTGNDDYPAWSPNGRLIAYSTDGGLSILASDGSQQRPLTSGSDDLGAAWSPDGALLAFTRFTDEGREVWMVRPDGTGRRRLAASSGAVVDPNVTMDPAPAWAPDGRRLAFDVAADDGTSSVGVVNADGRGLRVYKHSHDGDFHPSWSADGTAIVVTSWLAQGEGLGILSADSAGPPRIVMKGYNTTPSWLPAEPQQNRR